MQRITDRFEFCRKRNRKALVGFLCAGDPDLQQSEKDMRTALDAGVDILEMGVPFSDPTADGPTIQAAAQRALAAGITLDDIFGMAARLRADYPGHPIVLFGYANPFFARGYSRIAVQSRQAGIDALLVVDLPYEEEQELKPVLREAGLDMIPLIAPTTSIDRAAIVLRNAGGFVYLISVTGVTGSRSSLPSGLQQQVAGLRQVTELPIVVGFGIGNGEQARRAAAAADGVVVGSALVQAARQNRLTGLVKELRTALNA